MTEIFIIGNSFLFANMTDLFLNKCMPHFRTKMIGYTLSNKIFEGFLKRNASSHEKEFSSWKFHLPKLSDCFETFSIMNARDIHRYSVLSNHRNVLI